MLSAGPPVGHHQAGIAPLLPEDGGEQLPALRGPLAVDDIVGAHNGPGLFLPDDNLKGLQVNLPQGTLGQAGIALFAVRFLVVAGAKLSQSALVYVNKQ